MIKYHHIEASLYHASSNSGSVAIYGLLSDMVERGLVDLEGKPLVNGYVVCFPWTDRTSHVLSSPEKCRTYIYSVAHDRGLV